MTLDMWQTEVQVVEAQTLVTDTEPASHGEQVLQKVQGEPQG